MSSEDGLRLEVIAGNAAGSEIEYRHEVIETNIHGGLVFATHFAN